MKSWLGHIPRVEARAVMVSLGVGIVLLIVKFAAYYVTQSAAIFSDAVESIANVMASTVALYSLSLAHSPADEEHPYGHGKVEFLSAFFEGGMILLAAVFILVRTGDALLRGQVLQQTRLDLGLGLMAVAMLINGGVGVYLIRTGRKQGSMTLEADGKHLLSDALTSVAAIAALVAVKMTGIAQLDPVAALVIGVYIGWVAIHLLRGSADRLMDKQDLADERVLRGILRGILDGHTGEGAREPRICSYHKLRHRHSGRYLWIDFHMVVPASWSIARAHDVAGAIEGEIEGAMGPSDATAHIEPCDPTRCGVCGMEGGRRGF